jgi:peptidoglycan/xylan/chitin deacetylase (PgdA/CDA1 family)
MYHGVTGRQVPIFNWCQLALARFEEQIEFLSREYVVLPLADVLARLRSSAPLPERVACITFDDGFLNVYSTAFPVLARYEMPSTVFLVTKLIGTRQPAWPERVYDVVVKTSRPVVKFAGSSWPLKSVRQREAAYVGITELLKAMEDERRERHMAELLTDLGGPTRIEADSPLATMNWEEIDQLWKTRLVAFGSHTHTHPILSRCTPAQQLEELMTSRRILLEHLGSADLFAYPNGGHADFTQVTQQLVKDAGYHCGLSTLYGLNAATTDIYALRRVNVGADADMGEFEAAMAGL